MNRRPRDPRTDRRGVVALEFALVAPMLMLMFVSVAEIVAYMRTVFRVERVSAEVANMASQYEQLRCADLTVLFDAARAIAGSINVTRADPLPGAGGRTVVTVLAGQTSGNAVLWQEARGDAEFASQLNPGTILPNNFRIPTGQTVLVVEAVSGDRGWVASASPAYFFTPEGPVRALTVLRPRVAQLSAPPADAESPPARSCPVART